MMKRHPRHCGSDGLHVDPLHFGHVDELALADGLAQQRQHDLTYHLIWLTKTELLQEWHCWYFEFQRRPAELTDGQAPRLLQLCLQRREALEAAKLASSCSRISREETTG